ncbi:hypothetical protein [Microbispora sp. CA-102843]|uniref:hypothetical protein n=1 Tax=Microbispora sp. CA-102843 TaxID=3239952 RepID=UPI003D89C0D4
MHSSTAQPASPYLLKREVLPEHVAAAVFAGHPTISIDRKTLAARALDVVDTLAAINFAETEHIRHVVRSHLLWREST